jgi:integrase
MKVTSILYSRPLKNGTHQIKIRVHENGKTTYQETGFSVDKKFWDNKRRRLKETKSHPEFVEINEKLGYLESVLRKDKDFLLKIEPFLFQGFIVFFEQYVDLLKIQGKYNTYRKYDVIKRNLTDFVDSNPLHTVIDRTFLNNFEKHLIKKGLEVNGVHSYFKVFRNILNKCSNDNPAGYPPQNNPFLNYKLKLEKINKQKMSVEQLNKFTTIDLKENRKLEEIRLYFMFSFFSGGMRISDLMTLRWGNLKGGRITYLIQKTKKRISLPILNAQLEILKYFIDELKMIRFTDRDSKNSGETPLFDMTKIYNKGIPKLPQFKSTDTRKIINNEHKLMFELVEFISTKFPNDYVFPILDRKKINSELDVLKQIQSKSVIINRGLKEISKKSDIGIPLSFHIARHTFSDLMRRSGKSIYDISKILGHSDISITETYLKSLDYEVTDKSLEEFYDSL